MSFLYKTLYYKDNPDAEYQYRGIGKWYKRKKGSDQKWYKVDSDQIKYLQSYFKNNGHFFNYSATAKIGGIVVLVATLYFVNKKYDLIGKLIKKNGKV
jgi:hypothetical protein